MHLIYVWVYVNVILKTLYVFLNEIWEIRSEQGYWTALLSKKKYIFYQNKKPAILLKGILLFLVVGVKLQSATKKLIRISILNI